MVVMTGPYSPSENVSYPIAGITATVLTVRHEGEKRLGEAQSSEKCLEKIWQCHGLFVILHPETGVLCPKIKNI